MVCTRESFVSSPLEKLAIRLSEEHASLYRDLEQERGIGIGIEETVVMLYTV
ncbi:MAG: hypothetical protein QXF10_09470 [Ignisphaera sp.]